MGLDMDHQAVPAGSGLLERAREDPDLGQSLFLAPSVWIEGANVKKRRSSEPSASSRSYLQHTE
jgi:hypothetical protein